MPLFFWKDEDGKKYHSSYFEKFPNVWRHGDFAVHTKEGGFIILGRSDATLNPGGVRIGTADIYRVVETIPEIVDSLVIGQKWKTDERVILFVKLKQGMNLTDSLIEKIKQELRTQASPRHVPEFIFQVSDIPYTRNLKKVELTVKSIFEGRAITNKDSLHNPEVLEEYEKIYKNLNF
jgi:acetoacetyl-CoA synthetase